MKPLSATYTCDGADTPLPISWGAVPANTAEVDIFIGELLPVNEKVVMAWSVAGLKPSVHSISGGHLPAGAIVGRNSLGQSSYSVCPAKGKQVRYEVLVDPLPQRVPVKPGFAEEALLNRIVHLAESEGEISFVYERR